MRNSDAKSRGTGSLAGNCGCGRWLAVIAATCALYPAHKTLGADTPGTVTSDPVLNLMLEKGMITENEAAKVQAQVDARRTNPAAVFPESKWKISSGIKDLEIFGDVRLRYEGRTVKDPKGGEIDYNRLRYALRLGLRGDLFDDFYYGFRLETSSNPRSTFVTMGSSTSSSSAPYYQGPFGKSTAGIDVGQIYLGWHPEPWVDVTLGKMPNPLYTSPMVWNSSINPEGAVEQFKYTIGEADLFASFGQFLYEDTNPTDSSGHYFNFNGTENSAGGLPFLLALQGGVNYHLTKQVSLKVAPVLYQYTRFNQGRTPSTQNFGAPNFAGTYVGQGSTFGPTGTAYYNLGPVFDGFYANQTGINNLQVLEFPFEFNVKLEKVDVRLFGDYAQNLDGNARAQAAYNASKSAFFILSEPNLSPISSPQTSDTKAYQFGLAVGSKGALGLVNGTTAKKHSWEVRTYWQHVEQYALDPNLIDLDFFNGVENLEGFYAAAAYGFTDNFIGTVRYGYASRINKKLGTGGSSGDIPQMNPIDQYQLFQVDLTFKF